MKSGCDTIGFCKKVRILFAQPDDLLRGPAFRELILGWSAAHQFTNMWTERMLARIRGSTGLQTGLELERIVASGMLTQPLSEHRRLDRPSPVAPTKAQLESAGVKTR